MLVTALRRGLLCGLAMCVLHAQSADTRPAFEVASLKLNRSTDGVDRIKCPPGSLIVQNVSLKRLIGMAYGVAEGRDYLFSGPDWMDSTNFDILAKFPPETSAEQAMLMLQRLLDERFKMKFHREAREFSVYALVQDKRGHKLRPSETPGAAYRFSARAGHAAAASVSMGQFADRLSRTDFGLGRRVVDSTGLSGTFDFTLDWLSEGDVVDNSSPSIFAALPEQLGLKLEPRKVSLEVLVVDSALKVPVDN